MRVTEGRWPPPSSGHLPWQPVPERLPRRETCSCQRSGAQRGLPRTVSCALRGIHHEGAFAPRRQQISWKTLPASLREGLGVWGNRSKEVFSSHNTKSRGSGAGGLWGQPVPGAVAPLCVCGGEGVLGSGDGAKSVSLSGSQGLCPDPWCVPSTETALLLCVALGPAVILGDEDHRAFPRGGKEGQNEGRKEGRMREGREGRKERRKEG